MEDYKRKYEEALENLKKIRNSNENNKELVDFIEYNYPELKESEDEMIRKWLIKAMKHLSEESTFFLKVPKDKVIAWLEKQDPKKHEEELEKAYKTADEVQYKKGYEDAKREFEKQDEQKFKVGDWVVTTYGGTHRIEKIKNNRVYVLHGGCIPIEDIDHIWSIEDAKDGDVLYIHSFESDCVFLYQNTYEIEPNRNVAVAYCCIDVYANIIEFGIQGPDCIDVRNVKPATKEQRDLLFQKMKEAGYEWDAEKKELKKTPTIIEQKPAEDSCKISDDITTEEKDMTEYKKGFECGKQRVLKYPEEFNLCEKSASAWSEEDEKMWSTISDLLWEGYKLSDKKVSWNKIRCWLLPKIKSLKERYTWKPSEEQMTALRRMKAAIAGEGEIYKPLNSLYEDLKN